MTSHSFVHGMKSVLKCPEEGCEELRDGLSSGLATAPRLPSRPVGSGIWEGYGGEIRGRLRPRVPVRAVKELGRSLRSPGDRLLLLLERCTQ